MESPRLVRTDQQAALETSKIERTFLADWSSNSAAVRDLVNCFSFLQAIESCALSRFIPMTSPLIDGVDPMRWSADGACHGVGLTSGTGEPRIESHMTLKA